jgi:exonuclease SbcC
MNTDKILKLAGTVVSDLIPIEDNIYKGVLNINNKVAGVYYFDLNNAVPENFDDYQDRIFAKEFYASPGSLQWNYYLFLLNDQVSADQRITIEKNDKYARKYVLDEGEFEDFFTDEKSNDQLDSSLVGEWKASLDAADLQELYTDATYVAAMERFNSGKTLKLAVTTAKKDKRDALKINFINKIILRDNYRAFPKFRELEFGKVNLIRGINGVGKTSLFEAIELMICGKCFRNPGQDVANACIEAEFNSSGRLEKYQSGSAELYQARDFQWYSSNYNRGNYLFNSFNRFNFFNADAAHRFSTSNSEEEIQSALNNIVLGPEFSYIEERCEKFMDRVRPEYNKLNIDLNAARKDLTEANAVIANNKETDGLKIAKAAAAKGVAQLKFKGIESDDLTTAEGLLNQLLPVLENFKRPDFTYETRNAFDAALRVFNAKKKRFDELETKMRGYNDEVAKHTQNEKTITGQIDLLNKLLTYFEDEQFLKLVGLGLLIKEAELNKNKADFLKSSLADIDLNKTTSADTPANIIELNIERIDQFQAKINELEKAVQDYLDRFSKIDGMIKQLKAIGKDFLDEDKSAADCPLCQSAFTRQELERRIMLIADSGVADQSKSLGTNRDSIKVVQRQMALYETELQLVRRIDNAFKSFNPDADKNLSLTEIAALLNQAVAQSSALEADLESLRTTLRFAQSMGKSETELASLKLEAERILGDLIDLDSRVPIDVKLKTLNGDLEKDKLELKKINDERLTFGAELKEMLDVAPDKSFLLKEGKEIMDKQEAFYRLFDGVFKQLEKLIDFSDDSVINTLRNHAEVLVNQLETYKSEIKSQFVLDEAIKRRDKSKDYIEKNEPRFERYEKAYQTLLGMTGTAATDQLGKFFEANFAEIVDVFKSIHVPREFGDLKYEDKHLLLVTHDDETRTISQISTGQRSALALSIFLCLNKKLRNGPDIILFDDPVSFIDDFNALSFLDYLRRDMLSAGKQVFFATANTRLASLFEKKFSFLDKDFKQWEFTR